MDNRNEKLAIDIYRWCKRKELWGDNCIYFDNIAWASWPEWKGEIGKEIDEDLYQYENKNPKDYFQFANPDTLSMSYEGRLYHVLNGNVRGWVKLESEFLKLFETHGYYAKYGNAWNLAAYEI